MGRAFDSAFHTVDTLDTLDTTPRHLDTGKHGISLDRPRHASTGLVRPQQASTGLDISTPRQQLDTLDTGPSTPRHQGSARRRSTVHNRRRSDHRERQLVSALELFLHPGEHRFHRCVRGEGEEHRASRAEAVSDSCVMASDVRCEAEVRSSFARGASCRGTDG